MNGQYCIDLMTVHVGRELDHFVHHPPPQSSTATAAAVVVDSCQHPGKAVVLCDEVLVHRAAVQAFSASLYNNK